MQHVQYVLLFSIGNKFQPVSNLTELHTLVLAALSLFKSVHNTFCFVNWNFGFEISTHFNSRYKPCSYWFAFFVQQINAAFHPITHLHNTAH